MADELAGLLRLVHSALREATGALLDEPTEAAERARAAAKIIGILCHTMEEDAGAFTPAPALLGPELGSVLLGAHTGTEVEGLADVTVQLVELAWLRRDRAPLPSGFLVPLRAMAGTALGLVEAAAAALEPQLGTPHTVRPDAALLTRQQRLLYESLLAGKEPVSPLEASDVVLISCRLVRAGQHALSVVSQAPLLAGSTRAR
jgi:hypothetical protein